LTKDKDLRQFDYDTITDVIVHVSYTAREGGGTVKNAATAWLRKLLFDATERKTFIRLFSAKHEFPNQLHKFLHPAEGQTPTMTLDLSPERLPSMFRDKTFQISSVQLLVKRKDSAAGQSLDLWITAAGDLENSPDNPPGDTNVPTNLQSNASLANLLHAVLSYSSAKSLGRWTIKARRGDIIAITDMIENAVMVCHYKVTI
jgi:hypothetical protein